MDKRKIFIGCYAVVIAAVFGCTTKTNESHESVPSNIESVMDTIVAKLEFEPLTAKEISPSISRLIRGKVKLDLPKIVSSDSSEMHFFIGDLAVANAYIVWSEELNLSAVEDTAKQRTIELLEKVNQTEFKADYSYEGNNDSLQVYLNDYLEVDSVAHLNAYYQAVSWLENLYITLNLTSNISNKKEYNEIILMQLTKGDELLEYLYDFQDYPPISDFSILMLDILECRNYELKIDQLTDLVVAMREHNFQVEQ